MDGNLAELLDTATQAALLGGDVLESWASKFSAREKSPANLVTEADLASEQAIYEFIHSRYADHRFLGEEGLLHDEGNSPYRWIIDPLDGTSNYVHRFPYYAVSIGLEYDGELIVGVIFDPNRNELFSAAKRQGAMLNGESIRPSDNTELAAAMCMASLPVNATRDHPAVQRFLAVLGEAQTVQRTGSAALNLCCVACGRIDAFWSTSLKPWDQAAGALIVMESGASISKTDGELFDVNEPDILATNGMKLSSQLLSLLGG